MDGGQADIAGGALVVARALQVMEKTDDILGKDIVEIESGGLDSLGRSQKAQKQNQGIAIAVEGVGAQPHKR